MRRKIIGEFNKPIYVIDIMLYAIMCIIGYMLLNAEFTSTIAIYDYLVSIFFVCGFLSIIAYFLNKREDDYEFLFFGLINICVSCFILFNSKNNDVGFIISNSLLFYSLAYFLNKTVHVYKLIKKKSLNFIPKCAIMILVFILMLIATMSIYDKLEVAYVIYGYYFIGFGLLSIMEVLLILLINGKSVRKKMINFLDYKEEVKVKKEPKKIKNVKSKRITTKKVEKEIEEKEVVKQPKKKKKIKKDNK